MNQLIAGVIGCGMVAEQHLKNLQKFEEVCIKWICDSDYNKCQAAQQKYQIQFATENYRQILADKAVNVVIICTPPYTHFDILKNTILANKHCLVEKPLVINASELTAIADLVQLNPHLTVMDCSARHSRLQPKFEFIKNMIQSGELGDIYFIHHNAVSPLSRPGVEYHPEALWFYQKRLAGGGPMLDWGVYDLAFHLGLLNDMHDLLSIQSMIATGLDDISGELPDFDVEEHAAYMMKFDQGLNYYWERASHAYNESINQTSIYGTRAGIKFNYLSWGSSELDFYTVRSRKFHQEKKLIDMKAHQDHQDDFYQMTKHFIDCVKGRALPILPVSVAIKHLRLIFAGYDSSLNAAALKRMHLV